MSSELALKKALEDALGERVRSLTPLSGGDAARAFCCTLENDRRLFVKTVDSGAPFEMEALGLKRLKTENGIRVPDVVAIGTTFLALSYISFGSRGTRFQEELGHRLALTHRACRKEAYGFDQDHVIGKTPQKNLPWSPCQPHAWAEFWWTHRLEPMLRRLDEEPLNQLGRSLEPRLQKLLGPTSEKACLIHGDLWSGNVAADEQGHPVIFDPAPSYSHREAEFGMTALFGGFTTDFMSAYHDTFPLAEGWQERQDLYTLYHVLNHAVLFGSGYRRQAVTILEHYV